MDSGELWLLNDVMAKPLHGWDSRKNAFRFAYDSLRRLSLSFVSKNGSPEINYEKILYGESQPGDKVNNLHGQTYQHFDTSGLGTNNAFDFKGNLLSMSHQLLVDYKNDNDWNASPALSCCRTAWGASGTGLLRPVNSSENCRSSNSWYDR